MPWESLLDMPMEGCGASGPSGLGALDDAIAMIQSQVLDRSALAGGLGALAQAASHPSLGDVDVDGEGSWLFEAIFGLAGKECRVLGDFFGYALQFFLFCFCMGSLLLKWYCEVPQRRLKVFVMDTSKQCCAAAWLHFLNLILAMKLPGSKGHQCAWYWVNLMGDSTLGLLIVFLVLRVSESVLGYKSGLYMDSNTDGEVAPDYCRWIKQILGFMLIVSIKKVVIASFLVGILPWSLHWGVWATGWIRNPNARLAFDMVLTPLVMDTFYFWVTDSFIKCGSGGGEKTKSIGGPEVVQKEVPEVVPEVDDVKSAQKS